MHCVKLGVGGGGIQCRVRIPLAPALLIRGDRIVVEYGCTLSVFDQLRIEDPERAGQGNRVIRQPTNSVVSSAMPRCHDGFPWCMNGSH